MCLQRKKMLLQRLKIEGMEPSRERLSMMSLYELIEDELATIEQEMKNETSN